MRPFLDIWLCDQHVSVAVIMRLNIIFAFAAAAVSGFVPVSAAAGVLGYYSAAHLLEACLQVPSGNVLVGFGRAMCSYTTCWYVFSFIIVCFCMFRSNPLSLIQLIPIEIA